MKTGIDRRIHSDLKDSFAELPDMMKSLKTLRDFCVMPEDFKMPIDENVVVTDKLIERADGETGLKIRVFEPVLKNESMAGVLWIHGGGYNFGSIDFDDGICQRIVRESNCVVISVEYRLAPEYPYPAGLEDCYSALTWMSDNAEEMSIDVSNIAVAGASAGGGLTVALCLLARDRKGPPITFQMPLYPMIDNIIYKKSSQEISDHRIWNDIINNEAWDSYIGNLRDNEVSKYAVPAKEGDYTGLPPAYTCVGDLDPFYDETIEFVMKLKEAEVPVELHLYPGCFHGFENVIPEAQVSVEAKNQYFNALKRALDK